MRYLVDTDWVINHLHRVDPVVRRLQELAPDGLGTEHHIAGRALRWRGRLYQSRA